MQALIHRPGVLNDVEADSADSADHDTQTPLFHAGCTPYSVVRLMLHKDRLDMQGQEMDLCSLVF